MHIRSQPIRFGPDARCSRARVAGSLLRAAGLPELVTESLVDYETLAVRLAADHAGLQVLRDRLRSTRLTVPLFDSTGFTRQIEAAFEIMWRRYLDGEPPGPFTLPAT